MPAKVISDMYLTWSGCCVEHGQGAVLNMGLVLYLTWSGCCVEHGLGAVLNMVWVLG